LLGIWFEPPDLVESLECGDLLHTGEEFFQFLIRHTSHPEKQEDAEYSLHTT
jgi:hypothetical protein